MLDLHVGLPETNSLNSRHVTLYAMQILVIFWTCRLNVISAAALLSERHFFSGSYGHFPVSMSITTKEPICFVVLLIRLPDDACAAVPYTGI